MNCRKRSAEFKGVIKELYSRGYISGMEEKWKLSFRIQGLGFRAWGRYRPDLDVHR